MNDERPLMFKRLKFLFVQNIIALLIIMVIIMSLGSVYAFCLKKTKYTVSTTVVIQIKPDDMPTTSETTKWSYATRLTATYEAAIKNVNIITEAHNQGLTIKPNALACYYEEDGSSPIITIAYSEYSKEDIGQDLVNKLNSYLEFTEKIIDEGSYDAWESIKGRFTAIPVIENSIHVSSGKVQTLIISFFIGIIMCGIFLFIKNLVNDKMITKEDVEEISDSTVLSIISIDKKNKGGA